MRGGKRCGNGWRDKNPELSSDASTTRSSKKVPQRSASRKFRHFPKDAKLATRKAGGEALAADREGDADCSSAAAPISHGSTLNYIKGSGDFTRDNPKRPQHPISVSASTACAQF